MHLIYSYLYSGVIDLFNSNFIYRWPLLKWPHLLEVQRNLCPYLSHLPRRTYPLLQPWLLRPQAILWHQTHPRPQAFPWALVSHRLWYLHSQWWPRSLNHPHLSLNHHLNQWHPQGLDQSDAEYQTSAIFPYQLVSLCYSELLRAV